MAPSIITRAMFQLVRGILARNGNSSLNAMVGLDGLDIEVCGAWVWVSGETYKHKAVFKEAGI